jgi:predicted nucleotidyltransferase
MDRNVIISFLQLHKQEMLQQFGATKIGLAGSYARDEANEDSDIDIIVEIQSDNKFRSFFNLLYYLQEFLGQKIDLATESSLKPLVRESILKDVVYV